MNFGNQGNRVKSLSCSEACQKVAVLGGDFGKFSDLLDRSGAWMALRATIDAVILALYSEFVAGCIPHRMYVLAHNREFRCQRAHAHRRVT